MTKNFIINTVKHTTFWAMTCLIALIMTGCGGNDSDNEDYDEGWEDGYNF